MNAAMRKTGALLAKDIVDLFKNPTMLVVCLMPVAFMALYTFMIGDATSDAGITALVVFILLLFVYFRMLCSALSREKDRTSRMLQIAFTAGVCGFMVQAMTDYSFDNYRVMFLFFVFLALGGLAARRSSLPEGGLKD